jgi:hypothetical protein
MCSNVIRISATVVRGDQMMVYVRTYVRTYVRDVRTVSRYKVGFLEGESRAAAAAAAAAATRANHKRPGSSPINTTFGNIHLGHRALGEEGRRRQRRETSRAAVR